MLENAGKAARQRRSQELRYKLEDRNLATLQAAEALEHKEYVG